MTLVLLIGGARSGKSRLAVERAAREDGPVVFVATGEAGDDEMAARIELHRARAARRAGRRSRSRSSLRARSTTRPRTATLVVDCLSLWVANVLERGRGRGGGRGCGARSRRRGRGPTIAVTNEVGLGIVPDNAARAALPRRARPGERDLGRSRGRGVLRRRRPRAEARVTAYEEARRRFDAKTKPRGSLGRLEELGCADRARSAASVPGRGSIRRSSSPPATTASRPRACRAYPQEVTAQMVANFAAGGAAINVLARQAGARLVARRRGRRGAVRARARALRAHRRRHGEHGARPRDDARTRRDAALAAGVELAAELDDGSTSSRSARWASATRRRRARSPPRSSASTRRSSAVAVPASTTPGVAPQGRRRPRARSRRTTGRRPARRALGGFEIAFLAGLALGCAAERNVVVLARRVHHAAPPRSPPCGSRPRRSTSPDRGASLARSPGMRSCSTRSGSSRCSISASGSARARGAALALPLLDASIAILREMATLRRCRRDRCRPLSAEARGSPAPSRSSRACPSAGCVALDARRRRARRGALPARRRRNRRRGRRRRGRARGSLTGAARRGASRVAVGAALTGALHLDALADTADALGGTDAGARARDHARPRDRRVRRGCARARPRSRRSRRSRRLPPSGHALALRRLPPARPARVAPVAALGRAAVRARGRRRRRASSAAAVGCGALVAAAIAVGLCVWLRAAWLAPRRRGRGRARRRGRRPRAGSAASRATCSARRRSSPRLAALVVARSRSHEPACSSSGTPSREETARGRCYGTLDVGLSQAGREHAAPARRRARRRSLRRRRREPAQRGRARPPSRSPRRAASTSGRRRPARDRFRRASRGARYDEIERAEPELFRAWMETPTAVRFPGGESYAELRVRAHPRARRGCAPRTTSRRRRSRTAA